MSESIRATAIDVLAPLIGRAMATVYVADAARCLGKTADDIEPDDVTMLCDAIRRKISPFAARPVVDQAMADILVRAYARQGSH